MPGKKVRHRSPKTLLMRIEMHKRRPAAFTRAVQRRALTTAWQDIVDTVNVDTGTLRANNNPWRQVPDLTKLPRVQHAYPSRQKVVTVAESLGFYEKAGITNPQEYGIYDELRTGAYQMAAVKAVARARHVSIAWLERVTGLS